MSPETKKDRNELKLIVAGVMVALALCEGLTRFYLSSRQEESGRDRIAQRERVLGSRAPGGSATPAEQFGRWEDSLELHPFFGYVFKPGISLPSQNPDGWRQANRMGFQTRYEITLCGSRYCIDGEADRSKLLVVGIFGGSFAHFAAEFSEKLEERLARAFPGRKPVVINFAMGGQAFPQSANIYNYFREVIDVPVFLDGLNEIWNVSSNNRAGVPPEYAKAAHFKVLAEGARQTPERRLAVARIENWKGKIRWVTELSLTFGIRQSAIVYLAWSALTNRWTHEIQREVAWIEKNFEKTEPFFKVSDEPLIALAARHWGENHRALAAIAKEQGTPSIHLLQPNPHVQGSKTLTAKEQELVKQSFEMPPAVVPVGYPLLRKEAQALKARNLVAEDLSDLYRGEKGEIWVDGAHANERGYALVLDRIAALVTQALHKR